MDPLRPHSHEPNLEPPPGTGDFTLVHPAGRAQRVALAELFQLPRCSVSDCYIVSTGHGTSGPFTFGGVRLLDLLHALVQEPWAQVEVLSADGFGTRVLAHELYHPDPAGPIILADTIDGSPLSRAQGLLRLIVPSERDDALRQVKWVATINVCPPPA